MKIIIDAMGGDNAPIETVRGACQASLEVSSELVLVGREEKIREIMAECKYDETKISIVHAEETIEMDDDPMLVVKGKTESSMSIGLKLLKEGADAFVSAGSTGALHTGATLRVRNMKGVRRAAIAALLPFDRPVLLVDSGANISVTPENLVQWAYTGAVYMKGVMGVEKPKVGLLNNGTEECKGTALQVETYKLLSECEDIDFVGNVESKEIPYCSCDVLVTDGFTGNIALKLVEGMSKFMLKSLKSLFTANIFTKLCFLVMKRQIMGFRKKYDSAEYGGAPILGISKPVIKAHGSSDAKAFKNAILQAERFAASGAIAEIEAALAKRNG
ncbi:MAG: phosphate acyltransferase PlsX [Clostridia bacterium]|nr:phosphate acyltransferase PlsX [Clostridia bacterium]MBR5447194.1 phosphate acyltransferase PlsX [Clostridia bacterium]